MDDGPDYGLRREAATRLATLLEFLPIAVTLFDSSGRVLVCTGAKRDLLGQRIPSASRRDYRAWEVRDEDGVELPPSQWPGKRILRREASVLSAFVRRRASADRGWMRLCVFQVSSDDGFRGGIGFLQDQNMKGILAHLGPDREQRLMSLMMEQMVPADHPAVSSVEDDDDHAILDDGGDTLSDRERQVLVQCAWGRRYKEIATDLGISAKTVEFHRTQGLNKLGLSSREDLVRYAVKYDWLHAE